MRPWAGELCRATRVLQADCGLPGAPSTVAQGTDPASPGFRGPAGSGHLVHLSLFVNFASPCYCRSWGSGPCLLPSPDGCVDMASGDISLGLGVFI
jgi:hypothetical protein